MIQRLYQSAQGIVKANGTVILTFNSVPTSLVWTGTISVSNALGTESWTANVGGSPWGSFIGSGMFGPVQAVGNENVTITASELAPGTIYRAVFIGTSSAEGEVPIAYPQPQPLTLAQIVSAITATVSGSVQSSIAGTNLSRFGVNNGVPVTKAILPPAGIAFLRIMLEFTGTLQNHNVTISVTGINTGFPYWPSPGYNGENTGPPSPMGNEVIVAIDLLADPSGVNVSVGQTAVAQVIVDVIGYTTSPRPIASVGQPCYVAQQKNTVPMTTRSIGVNPGTTVTIVPAPPQGYNVYIHGVSIYTALSSWTILRLKGLSGTEYHVWPIMASPAGTAVFAPIFIPLEMTVSEGLEITLDSGPTGNINIWMPSAYLPAA